MSTPSPASAQHLQPSPWRQALTDSIPIAMAYVPIGFAFGLLAVETGLPAWYAVLMSVIVYTGALQFAALPMLAGGIGLGALALTTLLLNLRHLLYALPLLPVLSRKRATRLYSLAALTDETYSMLSAMPAERRGRMAFSINLTCQAWWVAGTALGALLGPQIGNQIPNLGFALPCLFVILAIEQYLLRRQWLPLVLGIVAFVLCRLLLPQEHVLISALLLSLIGLVCHDRLQQRAQMDTGAGR
ncbi:MAG: AzlC family ABC transporter permease [Corticimicrobacter sp.]|uniref:AzlC family ABC transporter permease n=1 Tax=Corticimicrobacter sp. TaxID=2678536 RepID=UPI0032DAEFA2